MKAFLLIILFSSSAWAAIPSNPPVVEGKLCQSTKEYISTLKFLRTNKAFPINERAAREIADEVSKGCDGATERFRETFLMMTKMGVDHRKSVEIALEFSKEETYVQKNFFEIFQRTYLKEFFDFDFKLALEIAHAFSKNLKGNHEVARNDFINLVRFCNNEKKMGLSIKVCANIAIQMAKQSAYYQNGVYEPFQTLYKTLRTEKGFGLSIKDSLNTLIEVMKYGPKAPENFMKAYRFAIKKKGLDVEAKRALNFAITMAKRSTTSLPPPMYKEEVIDDGWEDR